MESTWTKIQTASDFRCTSPGATGIATSSRLWYISSNRAVRMSSPNANILCQHLFPISPNNTTPPPPRPAGTSSGNPRTTSIASRTRRSSPTASSSRRPTSPGPAPGPCPQQHPARHPHPPEADAGLRRALDAGHRPRGHRHAGGRRTPLAAGGKAQPPRTWPRRAGRPDLAVEERLREADPRPAQGNGLLLRLGADPLHARSGLCPGGAAYVLQDVLRPPHLPRQAAGELGHDAANGRQRRRSLSRDRQRATSGTSAIR